MVKGTNQIITMLQFYLYLFFCFLHLVLEEGEEDVEDGPRAARASHRLSEALCLGSTLVRPGPSVLAKRRNFLLVRTTPWLVGSPPSRPMVGRLLCCLCLQNPLTVSGARACLLAPVLLAAEKCRGFLPIIAETRLSAGSMQSL